VNEANFSTEAVIWSKRQLPPLFPTPTTMSLLILQLQWNASWQISGWWMPAACFYSLNWKQPSKKEDSKTLRCQQECNHRIKCSSFGHLQWLFCANFGQDIKRVLQLRDITVTENKRAFFDFMHISFLLSPVTLLFDLTTLHHSDIQHRWCSSDV
jgi:hypothetical protein